MNTHADKTQESKSQSAASAIMQKQPDGSSGIHLEDNRPETVVQRKLQEAADTYTSQPSIQKKENNTGLPDNLKTGIENLSGISMDDVNVYRNSNKPAQLQAHAYAQGTDIHLGPGQEKHLPHEAWHVVQQKQGRVKPTVQMKGKVNINDDDGLEKEADVMGAKALQLISNNALPNNHLQNPRISPYTTQKVTQLYSDVSQGNIWGYGKGTGGNAPNFEFQEITASRTVNEAAKTIHYGIDANQVFENAPVLRVSDDRLLAVPSRESSEAKSFFATTAKIEESNVLLHNAGAPLRLNQGAGQIRLSNGMNPFGPTLNQVTPNLTNVVNNSSECGSFAENTLGTPVQNAETVNAAGAVNQYPGLGTQSIARDTTVNGAIAGQNPNTLGANERADPEVGEAFGIYARTQVPAPGIGASLWKGIIKVKDYITNTVKPHLQWGEHWAGVVAKAGGDYVTLENYNRVASDTDMVEEAIENEFNELRGQGGIGQYVFNTQDYETQHGETLLQRQTRLGENYIKYAVKIGAMAGHYTNQLDRWYFQMYGPGTQSFHDQFKDSAPNSVTFKTRGTDAQLKALLIPKLNALLPADNYQAGAAATLAAQIVLVNAAVGRDNITAAFVAAEKAICLARLASANVYEQTQAHNMIHLGTEYALAVINVNAAVGDNVVTQCNTGIAAMQAT